MGSGRAGVRRRRRGQSLWRGREVEGENTELTFPSSTFLYQSPPHAIAAETPKSSEVPSSSSLSFFSPPTTGKGGSFGEGGKGKPDGTKFVDRELLRLLLHGRCVQSCLHEGGRA